MAMNCRICSGDFKSSPDSLIICAHKDGAVHLGCCVHKCSWDMKPCNNSLGMYDKV